VAMKTGLSQNWTNITVEANGAIRTHAV